VSLDEGQLSLLVRQIRLEADAVVSLELVDPDGGDLPAWTPGSHLDLVLPSGLVRQYSLCGPLGDQTRYVLAVLREEASRGGSGEVHDSGLVGRVLTARGPRNRFALEQASAYLFIAGGIGITPILPMLEHVERIGAPWRLVYGARSRAHMAFVDRLDAYPDRVQFVFEDESGRLDLSGLVAQCGDAAIYACGPPGLLTMLEQCCVTAGRPLHLERFSAAPVEDAAEIDGAVSFEVTLARSGTTVLVPPDKSLLRCVRDVLPSVLFSCEEGYCGTCETRVLDGLPDHRDTVLTEQERAQGSTMMICVGRAHSARLVLDL
jgi:ferredoxin-NADP reductase